MRRHAVLGGHLATEEAGTCCESCAVLHSRLTPAFQGYTPLRTIAVTFVPDEEIGGNHGMGPFVESERFAQLNVRCASRAALHL